MSDQLAPLIAGAHAPVQRGKRDTRRDRSDLRATRRPAIGMTTAQSFAGVKAG
jgi:hypothetical protein